MHTHSLDGWTHDHSFGQDQVRPAEARTLLVVAITGAAMVVEVAAGLVFGSVALLADGLHMASHAAALGIAAAAYVFARRHADDRAFSFGTGKVNALAGFTSALLLIFVALLMLWESMHRLFVPVAIAFDKALLVTAAGLAVNLASAAILLRGHDHHQHDHCHDHDDDGHQHGHGDDHDHNLRGAILHVLADVATSVLALAALFGGKLFGAVWLDPVIGMLGAVMILRWARGLIRDTGMVLLDHQAPAVVRDAVRQAIEAEADTRVADLHVWSVAPGRYATVASVVTHHPRPPDHYKALLHKVRLPAGLGLVHPVIEVWRCPDDPPSAC